MRGVEVMFKCAFMWMLCYQAHQLLKSLVPGCIGKIKKTFFFVATDDLGWKFTTLSINALSKSSYKETPTDATAIHPLTRLCVSTYQLTMMTQIFMKPSKTAFLRSVNLTNLLFTQSIPQNTTTLRSSDHKLNLHVWKEDHSWSVDFDSLHLYEIEWRKSIREIYRNETA